MTVIKKNKDQFGIYNESGLQAEGSFTAGAAGLNPKELLEAAVAMCMTVVIYRMLERDGIVIEDDEYAIEVTSVKAPDSPARFEKLNVQITLPDSLSARYKNKLIISAERGCTIGNTLRKGVVIETNQYE